MVPNVVYVGMGKAGSTLLHKLFLKHPDICVSEIDKEINFFSSHRNWAKGWQWYESRFENYNGERWVIDISPGYHNKFITLQRIKKLLGEQIKIIFTFRRFTEFAFSRYLHRIRAKRIRGSFLELLEYENMFYKPLDSIVGSYIETFGRENVLLMHYEKEFNRASPSFEHSIYEFLDMPPTGNYYRPEDSGVNSGYYPRFVYAGDAAHEEEFGGIAYRVPEKTLVYCSGRPFKNIFWKDKVDARYRKALELEKSWTTTLDEESYRYVQQNYTEPLAERLEKRLGISFEHWYVKEPRCLKYSPAPLPDAYIANPVIKAERLEVNPDKMLW